MSTLVTVRIRSCLFGFSFHLFMMKIRPFKWYNLKVFRDPLQFHFRFSPFRYRVTFSFNFYWGDDGLPF